MMREDIKSAIPIKMVVKIVKILGKNCNPAQVIPQQVSKRPIIREAKANTPNKANSRKRKLTSIAKNPVVRAVSVLFLQVII